MAFKRSQKSGRNPFSIFLNAIMLAGGSIQAAVPAADYYVSTLGNDTTGNGSIAAPWASLAKISTLGNQTVAKTVYILPGNYVEFNRLNLPRKVSIFGAGDNTHVSYLVTGNQEDSCIFIGNRTAGNGAGFDDLDASLSISYIKFNGTNRTAKCPIYVRGSSNVVVHHCTFVDFDVYGPTWNGVGTEVDPSVQPSITQTGNAIHHCTITNCSFMSGTIGYGGLQFGNQTGFLAYDNYIEQIGRGNNANGYCIKHHRNGYNHGCKIYNNTLIRSYDDGAFNNYHFCIESWNFTGLEIYNNYMIGNNDLAGGAKGAYDFSVDFHHNVVGPITRSGVNGNTQAIEFEYQALGSCSDVIIRSNYFRNLFAAIYVYREQLAVPKFQNYLIKNNIFYNCRVGDYNNSYSDRGGFDNWKFLNNTIDGARSGNPTEPWCGLRLPDNGTVTNIQAKNNIIIGHVSGREILLGPGVAGPSTADTIVIQNNVIPGFTAPNFSYNLTPTNVTVSGTITTTPTFQAGGYTNTFPVVSGMFNYKPLAGSNVLNAGLVLAEVTDDYEGVARSGSNTIGAFQ